jgi:protein-disulfide isomerase
VPTRRQVVIGTAILGTAALALGGTFVTIFGTSAPAVSVPSADLMQPGPLGEQAIGPETAPVTIIEYASMTCPHCANFAVSVFPKLKERYVDTGKVRFIFREFPLDDLALAGFKLARCVDKDKYFSMVDALFQQQSKWVVPNGAREQLLAIAKQAGFTEESFSACLANQNVQDGILWVSKRGEQKFKISATPTFFINGELHQGEMSLEDIEKAIQPYLKA